MTKSLSHTASTCATLAHFYSGENKDLLQRAGFHMRCGDQWLFLTVEDAISHAKNGVRLVCYNLN